MPTDPELGPELRRERARQHRRVLAGSALASAAAAAAASLVLGPQCPLARLLAWLGGVAAVLVLRLAVGWAQGRDARADEHAARWLLRHRLVYALHGLAWAALVLVPGPAVVTDLSGAVLFALLAVTAGALTTTHFDLRAALLFTAAPVAAAVVIALRLAAGGTAAIFPLGMVLLAIVVASAVRSQRALVAAVALRLAEARRSTEARHSQQAAAQANLQLADQHRLLQQLLQTTQEGFWFVDNEGRTTDLNPAMATLLGRPREAILGRRAHDFFGGADLTTLHQQLALRARGLTSRFEVDIVRPDGTRVHCVAHGTPLFDAAGKRSGSVGIWTDITANREAESALRNYELAVNSITDLVAVTDEGERYRLVNDAWCRATGLVREQVLGRTAHEVLPQGVSAERQRALLDALASGEVRTARGSVGLPGLPDRLVETTYYPSARPGAKPGETVRHVAMVTRDITEQEHQRRALEAREADQRALLEAFPGHIGRLDADMVYTYANRSFAAAVGLTPEQVIGRPAHEVLGLERAAELAPLVQRVLKGEVIVYEHRHPVPDGTNIDVQVTLCPGVDPTRGAPVFYGFAIDVTAQKQAEEALIAARDEAERANRAKSRFLSQMSHELRTPLNAIQGFGQLLQTDAQMPLVPKQEAWVGEILHGAEHLLSLINEILDLGRIESDEMQMHTAPVALLPVLEESLALMRSLAQSRAVRLLPLPYVPPGAQVMADRKRLKQVLLNLLTNAVKYNRVGGEVELLCRMEEGQAWLAVRDTGRGLTPAEQQRLFQPFERLGAAQAGIEGTGIGLALSRRLVLAMGGSIGVDSQPGAGSTFWLRLPGPAEGAPLQPLPEPHQQPAAQLAGGAPRTVLYIEDNPVNVVLMQAMLERAGGVRLVCAAHPGEGLRLAQQEKPALVLLDIQLPDMDGFEVLALLRRQEATRQTPVVAVSANALPRDIDAALAAGFNAYLTKPLALDSLLSTVRRLLAAG